ncbi:MAG TPA: DUF4870 domain-containing protein [Longimicrobiaceae bacterium]|jgi:uncharacterized Tic20 family protein|nr:DUF4870 domain-containing protein [Longimicrobiaceae bacterium]
MDSTPFSAAPEASAPALTQEERTNAMLCHVLSLCGYVIPMGHIIGPLIIWLSKKDTSAYVDRHGRESLNFQISMMIYVIGAFILMFLLVGFFLLPVLAVFHIVVVIIASMRANEGREYRYPLCIRFL